MTIWAKSEKKLRKQTPFIDQQDVSNLSNQNSISCFQIRLYIFSLRYKDILNWVLKNCHLRILAMKKNLLLIHSEHVSVRKRRQIRFFSQTFPPTFNYCTYIWAHFPPFSREKPLLFLLLSCLIKILKTTMLYHRGSFYCWLFLILLVLFLSSSIRNKHPYHDYIKRKRISRGNIGTSGAFICPWGPLGTIGLLLDLILKNAC